MKRPVDNFKGFLAEKLLDGSLIEEWDESLGGMGESYVLSEDDLEAVDLFCSKLVQSLQRAVG